MTHRLDGKVALVTGGASGIGAATSRLFVAEGARVIVADRQEPLDPALARLLTEQPGNIRFVRTDVCIEADIVAAVALALASWGRLDAAVACAGVPGQGSDVDLAIEEWDRIMAVNARGVFLTTKHAVPAMLRGGGGSIINISSAYGIVGAPGYAA